jgi:plastocyanin
MMRRGTILLAVGAILVSLLVVAGCGSSTRTTPTTPKKTSPSTTPSLKKSSVSIIDFAFQPASLTVTPGTTVTWTNNGATAHNITFTDFNSGNVQPGQTYNHVFATPGTYPYNCSIHPSMTGTITVSAGTSGGTTTTPSGTTTSPAPGY